MMENTKNDPRDCTVCFVRFNAGRRCPRILVSCGHSFCSVCINEIKKKNNLRCPYCSRQFNMTAVEDLPVNHALLQLLEQKAPPPSSLGAAKVNDFSKVQSPKQHAGVCDEHGQYKLFHCATCDMYICHVCTVVDHPRTSCSVVSIKKALENIKASEDKGISSEISCCGEVTQHLNNYSEQLDNKIKDQECQIEELLRQVELHKLEKQQLGAEKVKVRAALLEGESKDESLSTSQKCVAASNSLQEAEAAASQAKLHKQSAQAWRLQCSERFPDVVPALPQPQDGLTTVNHTDPVTRLIKAMQVRQ
ncbi:tripartite motif-containing protein 65-like isoform X1 [Homarus americanus]|uniref:tripartite motif-containing protein 65-like isoform X1 n=1 Tax=Homarus americanus TaxID=6706 RepID=UPI001C43E986|nr:tripartite motif-containing protein 65-like isoform X1 [Homarus americanus]